MELPAPYAPYRHEKGYIVLPIALNEAALPRTMEVGGYRLTLKDEFHITLVGKTVTCLFPDGDQVVDLFARYVAERPIRFAGLENEFRLASEADRRTLVVRARVANLEGLFEELRKALGQNIPLQATHVTLYTLEPGKSIAIPNEELWNSFAVVEIPELFDKIKK